MLPKVATENTWQVKYTQPLLESMPPSSLIAYAVFNAQRSGYRLARVPLVASLSRQCCPIGALWMANLEHLVDRTWQQVFMKGFDGKIHQLATKYMEAHLLGIMYANKIK